jgi:DNA adenine methylase
MSWQQFDNRLTHIEDQAQAKQEAVAMHERLASVTILNRDAFKVLAMIEDTDETAIYADPPYLLDSRSGKDRAACYRHEFADEDHVRLAESLRRFKKARVVVSYYQSERLAELYPSWQVLDCTRRKHLSVQGHRGACAQDAPECLVINGDIYSDESLLF